MDGWSEMEVIFRYPGASYMSAWRLELLFGLHWMSQETGLIRAGACVREQRETKTCRYSGSAMNTSSLVGLFADERCML